MNILDIAIAKKLAGGGGGSGTDNYNDLSNLPQINGETLAGNKTAENLGLQDALTFDSAPTEDSTNPVESGGVYNALAGKQDNLTFDGVYNASTNKAATESTVTNAIAGLDVSAFSVDADETISSISETDGKINVTKQDIAIASNQVTAMTGYTKPSSAPATPAIQTSDTANQAFGKLEFKADTNQTNILYSLQTGVKNICNPDTWILGYYLKPEDGSLIPYPGDNGITSDFIPVDYSSEDYYYISGLQNDGNNLYNVIHAFNASKQFLGRTDGTLDTTRNVYTSSFTGGTPVGTGDIAYIRITQYGTSGHVTNIDTSLVMVCTGHAKEQSPSYQPFARPNYDLTRLEAEDRAALADAVDEGAKNEFKFGEFTDGGTGASITISGQSVTVTNSSAWAKAWRTFRITKNTTYVLSFRVTNIATVANPYYRVSLGNNHHSGGSYYGIIACNTTGSYYMKFTAPTDTDIYFVLNTNYNSTAASDAPSMTVDNIMVCTEADWKVSQNYAPFALPNTDLTRMMTPFFTVPINHNMIYRGQNLGDTLTADQDTALSSGNFTDLYLGDYWTKSVTIPDFYELTTAEPSDWATAYTSYYTKSGDTYTAVTGSSAPTWAADTYYQKSVPTQTVTLKAVIADFDTFYAGYASTYAGINTHHAAVIVTGFSNVVWNKTNSTAGGYVNSLIHKWLVGSVLPQIETWFGSAKVLSHQKLLTNAITGDAASGWAWSSQKISLLSENQMYGSKVWGNSKAANGGYEPGEAFKHLNVFNHIDANLLFGNRNIWLRDIASAVWSAGLSCRDGASYYDASITGIAPAALILLS